MSGEIKASFARATVRRVDIIDFIECDDIILVPRHGLADMSSITIRNLDPKLKERLRVRAAEHGHSMEAEARRILQVVLPAPGANGRDLYARIRARFAPLGGADLELPGREPAREPPNFN